MSRSIRVVNSNGYDVNDTLYGLSTDTKPTTGVNNGQAFYAVDTATAFIFYNGTWYQQ